MDIKKTSHFGADALLGAKRIMFVGAHPDDIEFYCGAAISLMTQRNISITYLIATRGDHGLPGALGKWMKRIRMKNQDIAAGVLGVHDVILLDYDDGHLSDHITEFAVDISTAIKQKRPDIILSWDPDHIYNPHLDHTAAGQAVYHAHPDCKLAYYGTTEPDLLVPVDGNMLKMKLKSIRCHKTEAPWFYYPFQRASVIQRLKRAGALAGLSLAECFRLNTKSNVDNKPI
jgi:LmbE family N-acetylglucosaminyl deacetylase